ncbi:DUF4303 domain-containing protein [Streptomyces sp. V2I9]|uniref:DUF4303 domain-containing protein n=1 Tax=Streptomyces sp. V2I9 TaxID=3042304 RepID=UPI00277FF677|nr:DUF4303 domain-containing protein [Streptomyces sp. V2I9]MDQ0983016.1 hypothetical protein [Streptomyces sp. V2I9]
MAGDTPGAWTTVLRERIVMSLCATVGPMLRGRTAEDLYALAITTDSDIVTLRLVAHTEEALQALLLEGGEGAAEDADHYRWWPDEWRISDDGVTPENGSESTVDLCKVMFAASGDVSGHGPDAHEQWRERARAMLENALGDPRVRARLAEVEPAWRPVLFVTDTDGDMRPTVRSIDVLNAGHPNSALVASAREYFD